MRHDSPASSWCARATVRFAIDRVEGKIDLETEDGSIGGDAKPSTLRAHTSDGSIRIQMEPDATMAEDWDVQTADGTVVLTLPTRFQRRARRGNP